MELTNESETIEFGKMIGSLLCGGEIIELIGDVGAGKTTLVKGIAIGLGITEYIQSPSFTINRTYKGRDDIILSHYDFYRLNEAGIMADDLSEVINNPKTVTVIEWAEIVDGILPKDRLSIKITTPNDTSRNVLCIAGGEVSEKLKGQLA